MVSMWITCAFLFLVGLSYAVGVHVLKPFQCEDLQKIIVKKQWVEAFGVGEEREEFSRQVWTRIFGKHPELREEYFQRVRGDNIRSAPFKAHAARIAGAFDMAINLLEDVEIFEAHLHHLGHQHIEMHIPMEYFDLFRESLMEVADEQVGHCFDHDAWDVCTAFIATGIQISMSEAKGHYHWGYSYHTGPATWLHIAPAGRGHRQSPIDISPEAALFDGFLSTPPLDWNYAAVKSTAVSNNGHTVVMGYDGTGSSLSGGPLSSTYEIAQLHLHWGKDDDSGSEHRVNGHMYPAELHVVHWNKGAYGSFGEAVDKPDGLSVLGVFLEVGDTPHPGFAKMIEHAQQVHYKGDSVACPSTLLPTYLLPANTDNYWTYLGSLTTPPLYESVTWIVFQQPITVSVDQLEALRALHHGSEGEEHSDDEFHGYLVENYRPPQLFHGRIVRASFQ